MATFVKSGGSLLASSIGAASLALSAEGRGGSDEALDDAAAVRATGFVAQLAAGTAMQIVQRRLRTNRPVIEDGHRSCRRPWHTNALILRVGLSPATFWLFRASFKCPSIQPSYPARCFFGTLRGSNLLSGPKVASCRARQLVRSRRAMSPASCTTSFDERAAAIDWDKAAADLDVEGWTTLPQLLDAAESSAVAALYDTEDPSRFRSRVVMARHGFGKGEYRYFAYPLPDLVQSLRAALFPFLAPVANRWNERLRSEVRFPSRHADFIERCHEAGQSRPTPLLLRYSAGDYNCLHQDLYGEHVFPLQVAILLSDPGTDFTGGELVLTEQRPRMQSRAAVVPLRKGDAVVFAVNDRPVQGSRGDYRVKHRHGVSKLRHGRRHTLGIIFHDAT